jgi:hypothetical protein
MMTAAAAPTTVAAVAAAFAAIEAARAAIVAACAADPAFSASPDGAARVIEEGYFVGDLALETALEEGAEWVEGVLHSRRAETRDFLTGRG